MRTTFTRSGRGPARRLRGLQLLSAALAAVLPAALVSGGAPDLALAALAGAGAVAIAAGALRAAREEPLAGAPFVPVRVALHVEVDEQVEALRVAPHAPRAVVDREPAGAAPDALVVTEIEIGGLLGPSSADDRISVNLVLGDRVVRVDGFARREDAEELAGRLEGALSLGAHARRDVIDPGPVAGRPALLAVGAAITCGWMLIALLCVRTGTRALPRSLVLAGGAVVLLALAAEAVVRLALAPAITRHVRRVYRVAGRGLRRDAIKAAVFLGGVAAAMLAHARQALVPDGARWSWGRAPCFVDLDGDGEADLVGLGEGRVVAISGSRGSTLWTSFEPGPGGLDLICQKDLVIASTWTQSDAERSWVRPIDAHTGAVAWTRELVGMVTAAVSHGGCIAARTTTHAHLIHATWTAWDAASGGPCPSFPSGGDPDRDRQSYESTLEWEARRLEPAQASQELVVRSDERAWFGSPRNRPEPSFEVNAQNRYGELAWSATLRGAPLGDHPLRLVDGVLMVVTSFEPGHELRLTGLDFHHGNQLWAHVFRAPSGTRAVPLIVPQATRAVIGWGDRLWAVEAATGRPAWVYGG